MKFIWLSCTAHNIVHPNSKRISDMQPDILAYTGDTPYMASAGTQWGMPTDHTDTDAAPGVPPGVAGDNAPVAEARYRMNHEAYKKNPGVFRNRHLATRWIIDNHEIASGWSHMPANAQQYSGGGPQTQEHTNQTYQNAMAAFKAAHPQMLTIYESGLGDVPAEASSGAPNGSNDVSFYPPTWGSEIIGNTELFYIDCMAAKDPAHVKAYNDATKIMLGARQRAWLDAGLVRAQNDTNVDFKIIVSAKSFWTDATGGGQGFDNYQVQLQSIIDTYTAAGVTGVLWTGGDVHHPMYHTNVLASPPWLAVDFAGVTSSGAAQVNGLSDASITSPPDLKANIFAARRTDAVNINNFGHVEVVGTALTAKVFDQFGTALFTGTMIPTSNSWQTVG